MKNILFLSPHPDDVIFSCSDHIAGYQEKGYKVTIATVFNNYKTKNLPEELKAFIKSSKCKTLSDFQRKRNRENKKAIKKTGAISLELNLTDAVFRGKNNVLRYNLSTIFNNETHNNDKDVILKLIKNLFILKNHFDYVFIPYAIGNHIDHQIVKKASQLTFDKNKIGYYLEAPYFLKKENWKIRLLMQIMLMKKSIKKMSKNKTPINKIYKSQYKNIFGFNDSKPYPEILLFNGKKI